MGVWRKKTCETTAPFRDASEKKQDWSAGPSSRDPRGSVHIHDVAAVHVERTPQEGIRVSVTLHCGDVVQFYANPRRTDKVSLTSTYYPGMTQYIYERVQLYVKSDD